MSGSSSSRRDSSHKRQSRHSDEYPNKRRSYDYDNNRREDEPTSSRTEERDFSFTDFKYELSQVFAANRKLIEDTDDFWKFVRKYEDMEKKRGQDASKVEKTKMESSEEKKSTEGEDRKLGFKQLFARVPPARELTDSKLNKFRSIVIFYLDFKKKEEAARVKKLKESQDLLPVAKHREEIVEAVKNERVVIIAGDTGCGKSTQVPQYLFHAGFQKIGKNKILLCYHQ